MISKLRKMKILITISLILAIITGCKQKLEDVMQSDELLNQQEIIKDYNLTLFAVGDALIHDAVYNDAKTDLINKDGYNIYDFKPMLTEIKPLATSHDLAFYNQETIIGGKNLGLSNYPRFNSPDEIGLDMIDAGFNIVNLATNHTIDKGMKGALYSISFWENQPVYTTGSYATAEKRNNIKIAEKNGIKYAVLGYTYGTNGLPVEKGSEHIVNIWNTYEKTEYEEYKKTVKRDIESVRDKVDLLIVSMHWGNEYTHSPSVYQIDAAQFLAQQGVDIIIGTHPHVIQPIEYIGDTLVIYSLGNFISAQEGNNKRIGMMVSININKHIENKITEIKIENIKADLTWTYHEGYKKFKVIPFYNLNNQLLNNYETIYEEYKNIINTSNDDRIKVGF